MEALSEYCGIQVGVTHTDTAVILRATLSKGEDSHTRDFHLIVPSLDAEDARNMITVNPGFESSAPAEETSEPEGWLKHTKWVWGDDKIATETTYAQIDEGTSFTGAQSLRITVDETMAVRIAQNSAMAFQRLTYFRFAFL